MVVFTTYAVVDPLAVMVKSVDTFSTDVTMSRIMSEDHFARGTQDIWIILLNQFREAEALRLLCCTRVLESGY